MKIPHSFILVAALALGSCPLLADFTYDQTTQITGGALLGMVKFAGAFSKDGHKLTQPMPETVSIKGNRMLRKSADTATIVDLDQQTITTIQFPNRTYSVITFQQMKEQLAEMSDKMRSSKSDGQQADMQFDVKVNDTGNTKQIMGSNTHELITTMIMSGTDAKTGNSGAMNILTDMWIAPQVAGYTEVRDFNRRMAESLGSVPGQNPLLNRPDIAQAMARLYKDASKFDGIPLMTVTKVGISAQAANAAASTPASGTTPAPAPAADSTPKSSSSAQGNASAALAQALGGRFGLGRHKKDDSNNSNSSSSGSGDSSDASGALLEMTGQVNNFNSDSVDASIFNIPAGFSQVDAKLPGGKRR